MFSSAKVDYFFKWHWWSAHVTFLPLAAVLLFLAFSGLPLGQAVLSMIAGIFLWTLFEYSMHRFLFHLTGDSPFLKHFHYVVHGMHHAHATDPLRVIFPPFLSVITGALVAGFLALTLPLYWFFGVYASFIIGYTWYEFMHYADHHIKWKYPWFKRLKRHHLLHHHSSEYRGKNFGVTTILWDKVFNTFLA